MFVSPNPTSRTVSRVAARRWFPLAATCMPLLAGCVIATNGISPTGNGGGPGILSVSPSPGPNGDAPSIIELSANPSTVTAPGQAIALTCEGVEVSGAPSYTWSATGGALSTTQGQTVTWKPPAQAGNYAVTVLVSSTSGGAVTGVFNLTENASGSTHLVGTVPADPTPTPVPTATPNNQSGYGSDGGGGDGGGNDGDESGYGADGGDGGSSYYSSTTTYYYPGDGGSY